VPGPRLVDDATLATELVRAAGSLARRMRADGVDMSQKSSISDIVTAADHAAEELVVSRLREQRPADGVVGEEGAEAAGTSGRTWVIDPVDGTYNFFHGLTWWCSAIALRTGDDAVLGAVFHPHDDVVWVGGPDLATTRNGVEVEPMTDRPLGQVSVATYLHPPYFSQQHVDEPFRRVVARAATLRMLGSGSMDLSAVADGRLGLWFQHSVPAWDWLPGKALVEGAGGVARQVTVDGVIWSVAGGRQAVDEAVGALVGA